MISGRYTYDQLQEVASASSGAELVQASLAPLGQRVGLLPLVPSHASVALDAKVHALVQTMAASFAPSVVIAHGHESSRDWLPHVVGVRHF